MDSSRTGDALVLKPAEAYDAQFGDQLMASADLVVHEIEFAKETTTTVKQKLD